METNQRAEPRVAASVLGADLTRLGEEATDALGSGAPELHVDVMDGHFVPNLSVGPDAVGALRRVAPEATLEAHLMVDTPVAFVTAVAKGGADVVTFHIEACAPLARQGPAPETVIERIRESGAHPAMALNPETDVRRLEPHLDKLTRVLVMSVDPGRAGQEFVPWVTSKISALWAYGRELPLLEVDGGIDERTGPRAVDAGARVLVAASSLFASPDRAAAVRAILGR